MIDSEENYLKAKERLAQLDLSLAAVIDNPASDLDNRFYELYRQSLGDERADLAAQIAEYEARQQSSGSKTE